MNLTSFHRFVQNIMQNPENDNITQYESYQIKIPQIPRKIVHKMKFLNVPYINVKRCLIYIPNLKIAQLGWM